MADFSYLLGLASDQFPLFSVPAYTQLPYCIQTCVDAAVGDAATSSSCFDNGGAPATCLCSAASPIHERMSSVAEVQCPNVQGGASSGADAFSKYCLVNGAVVKDSSDPGSGSASTITTASVAQAQPSLSTSTPTLTYPGSVPTSTTPTPTSDASSKGSALSRSDIIAISVGVGTAFLMIISICLECRRRRRKKKAARRNPNESQIQMVAQMPPGPPGSQIYHGHHPGVMNTVDNLYGGFIDALSPFTRRRNEYWASYEMSGGAHGQYR